MNSIFRLKDVCSSIVDCEHKTVKVDSNGDYFAVGTSAMVGNRIDYSRAKRVSQKTFLEWTRRLTPQRGDLLLAREAPVGPIVRIPDKLNVAPGQRTVLLRPIPEAADSVFLYYLIGSSEIQYRLNQLAEGSTVPHLNVADIRSFELPLLPSLDVQRGIAATLVALDDKIESNRRIVDKIGALFSAEFSSVQKGKTSFVELKEVVSVTKGVSYRSADLAEARTSLVTLKSFDRNGGYKSVGLKPYVGPYKESQIIRPGELVVAQTDLTQGAEVVGRTVRVPRASSAEVLVASLDLAIVRPLGNMPEEYLYGLLTAESFREHCRSRTSGTTVLHLAGDAIPQYRAPMVSQIDQERFAKKSRPLIERSDSLEREIEHLVRLRDTLLPELLSGRIRVPEAREAVEAAV